MRGRFLTVEGLDGAGKSTHLAWVREYLEQHGIAVCVTREPGGTDLGEALRRLLLDSAQRFHPETEALLMFAARREHIDKVIEPALGEGRWVLCDRFTDASFAYQAGGSGVEWRKVETLEAWVQGALRPDLTLYFDVDPAIAKSRAAAIKAPDRFEQEAEAFHARVRAAYVRRAREHPQRIAVIDADGTVDDVRKRLEAPLRRLCEAAP
jgi:dTMP kinase